MDAPDEQPTTVLGPEGPGEPPSSRRLGWGMLLGILVVLAAAGAIAAIWLTGRDSGTQTDTAQAATTRSSTGVVEPGQVLVPDVVGLDQTEAAGRLAAVHLKPKARFRATAKPTGKVVEQRPKPGKHLDRGAEVVYVVDRGAPKLEIPDVTGRKLADARSRLEDAGFVVQTTDVTSGEPAGTVVDQAPEAGKKAAKGSSVTLSVVRAATSSTATATTTTTTTTTTEEQPSTVEVPDLVGTKLADAADELAAAGIFPNVAYVPSKRYPGTVVEQARDAGTTVERGTYVRINVAEGPNPAPDANVPNVKGKERNEARSTLADAGFAVKVVERRVSGDAPENRVVGEQPAGGTSIPGGATVVLIVGAH